MKRGSEKRLQPKRLSLQSALPAADEPLVIGYGGFFIAGNLAVAGAKKGLNFFQCQLLTNSFEKGAKRLGSSRNRLL